MGAWLLVVATLNVTVVGGRVETSVENARVSTTRFATYADCVERGMEIVSLANKRGQTVFCAQK
jgi:hypothetical protein